MEFIRGLDALAAGRYPYPVVALGNFDGVHLGHHALIRMVVERAGTNHGTGVVVTFDPHPLRVLAPEKAPPLLTLLGTKLKVLEDLGIGVVVCIPFTREFSEMSPEAFIEEVLRRRIGAREVVVGHNYAFGKGRVGNITLLRKMGTDLGFTVRVVDPVKVEGVGVSSSRIRAFLKTGDVEHAASLLGREFMVEGEVVPGHRRGETLGFPTANLAEVPEMLPKEGVYAVRVSHRDRILDGICYIGTQPTFRGKDLGVEVHLMDFSEEIYGEPLRVYFVARIRPDMRFENREALVVQIRKDIERAREILHPFDGAMDRPLGISFRP